jgi:hypothetical protein
MPRETLGYIRLVWNCPNCQSKNPGNFRFCRGCGAAQPKDVQFIQEEGQQLVQDAAEIAQAKQGPNIHCGYCGARNPASAKECSTCGADIASGTKRVSGSVTGAFSNAPAADIRCPSCGTTNPASALTCKTCGAALSARYVSAPAPTALPRKINPWLIGGIIGAVLIACIFLVVMLTRTTGTIGTVTGSQWERKIAILALQPVQRENWKSEVPVGAKVGTCQQRLYGESDQPQANSKKVCGTPYSVDKGNGYAEVVQDCNYEVYQDYCSYMVDDWTVVDTAIQSGSDSNPIWPQISLTQSQKQGNRQETYIIVFSSDGGQKTFQTNDSSLFAQARTGSRWTLNVNSFGSVVSIEPAE